MGNSRLKRSRNISGPGIATIRKKRGLTQLELAGKARALGVNLDRASIAKIENGLRCVLDYELHVISCILQTSVAKLLDPITADLRAPDKAAKHKR
jgi:transcriptional regulator with XRE-family HTH domain